MRPNAERETTPLVSVIIPTLNAAASLGECLVSVNQQTYHSVEVLVVDGGSGDATKETAEKWGAKLLTGPFRRSTARRHGATQSKGAFLLFLDADQVLEPKVVEECVLVSRSEGVGAVVIPEEDLGIGPWASCRWLERQIAQFGGLSYPRFISRSLYEAAGGHGEGLEDYMEDRDLYLRLSGLGVRIAQCKAHIINYLGRVNPLALGLKGMHSAVDANEYYRRNIYRGESLWRVVRPRIEASFRCGSALRGFPISGLFVLPIYLMLVYGPRCLTVLARR